VPKGGASLEAVTPPRVLHELEALAARIGLVVRAEPFGSGLLSGRGGLCWVRGRPLVVMDASLPVEDRIAVLARALARFDLDAVYVPPLVRARIESLGARLPRPKPPATRSRPGLARTKPG
jgi:hypothetical protein